MKDRVKKVKTFVEPSLEVSELRYRRLFEAAQDGILILDAKTGAITDVNPFLIDMLGYSRDEFVDKKLWEVGAFKDIQASKDAFEALQNDTYIRYEDLPLKAKDDHLVQVEFVSNVYLVNLHKVIQCNIRDITARKQAEEKRFETEKASAKIFQDISVALKLTEDRHLVELETLLENGLALNQLLSPKDVAHKLIELMSSKLNWHHTTIRIYHPEDESLEMLAFNVPGTRSTAELQEAEQRFKNMIIKVGDGLSGWAVQHNEVVRISDLSHDPRYVETASSMQSGLYVPLKVEEHVVGVISIESEKREAFSEADERLTVTLANQAAIALENARLHEETLHQLKQLDGLHVIDQSIAQSFDQSMMLDVLLTQTLNQLGAEAAAIFQVQVNQQQTLQYVAGKGFLTHVIEIPSLKLGDSIAAKAEVKPQMIQTQEPKEGELDPLLSRLWSEEGFKSMQAIPLISKGEVKGVMTVFHRKDFTPEPAWSSFFETLAGQAAIAMDVTQMFDSLQRANMELSMAYEATIEGWSRALDLRDKETEGHSQRVTELTLQMGKTMQLGEEDINHMRYGALLHDIGKLGVPDAILLKVEKLTDEEWLVMKKHPEFAYDMLHPIAYLRDSMDIPYCHHEKWDGSGYPQGLQGEQIPLAARIFAIVDMWDALVSDRPYRKAWSKPDTLQYIREQSGKHFDPQIVDIFLKEFEPE